MYSWKLWARKETPPAASFSAPKIPNVDDTKLGPVPDRVTSVLDERHFGAVIAGFRS